MLILPWFAGSGGDAVSDSRRDFHAYGGWLLQPHPLRADAVNGERLARQWCANCHVIDRTGPSATLPQGPPSFRVAAGHLNLGELRAFLTHPHGQMPDLALTRKEIDDLIAYIETLR